MSDIVQPLDLVLILDVEGPCFEQKVYAYSICSVQRDDTLSSLPSMCYSCIDSKT